MLVASLLPPTLGKSIWRLSFGRFDKTTASARVKNFSPAQLNDPSFVL
jgi:hypothetical protein